MELAPLFRTVIGLDVHHNKISACALWSREDGTTESEIREFGGFKRDLRALAEWVKAKAPEQVVMESSGIYWKSPFAALERVGIVALVVNARHVKNVPGRKTDIADAHWLAMLARAGLLHGSFVPPANLRALRLVSRQRQKLVGILSGEKNRLHKVLADAGIRLSAVVSDLHGKTARRLINGLLEGRRPQELLAMCDTSRLKASQEELLDALAGDLTAEHVFVARHLQRHIQTLEADIAEYDRHLLSSLDEYRDLLVLLQTLPGVDASGAAMMLVEIGDDMSVFGSAERLASWVGLCPGNNESAGKKKSGRIRKGNPWLRRLLCEFAQAAAKTRSGLQAKFQALSLRRGYKRAIVALAHKLLRIVYVLISRREYYRDSTIDYEAQMVARNAPRWFKMLRKHGFLTT